METDFFIFYNMCLVCLVSVGSVVVSAGNLLSAVAACVCEAGAGPAVAGFQRQRLHDVQAHRQPV